MMTEPRVLGAYNEFEIYPMPMFATIAAPDVNAVVAWYQSALGFATVFSAPPVNGQPALVHLRRRKYQDLLVTPAGADSPAGSSGLTITFSADGEVDELASRAHAAAIVGKASVAGPIDTPWNTRDVRVTDPLGNRLVFTGRNPNADPQQVERIRAMLDAGKK